MKVKTKQIKFGEFTLNYYERPGDDNDFELFYENESITFYMEPDDLLHDLQGLMDWLEKLADESKDAKADASR